MRLQPSHLPFRYKGPHSATDIRGQPGRKPGRVCSGEEHSSSFVHGDRALGVTPPRSRQRPPPQDRSIQPCRRGGSADGRPEARALGGGPGGPGGPGARGSSTQRSCGSCLHRVPAASGLEQRMWYSPRTRFHSGGRQGICAVGLEMDLTQAYLPPTAWDGFSVQCGAWPLDRDRNSAFRRHSP